MATGDMRLGIVVDTDTRATRQEFSALRREVKREAEAMGGDWESAAQKVEDALREAGARDDLIEAARRIGSEGPSEVERMQRALRGVDDTARTTADAVDDAARDMAASFEDNALTADDVLGAEVKAEVLTNAAEVGAEVVRGLKDGFDAEDMSTILDGLTDTIVSIGSLGGPAGLAIAGAGAAAMQVFAGPFLEEAEANAARSEEVFSSAFEAIVEKGAEMGRELTIQAETDKLVQDAERLDEAQQIAASTGADLAVVIRALSGDEQAYSLVKEQGAKKQEALNKQLADTKVHTDDASGSVVGLSEEYRKLIGEQSTLDGSLGTLGESFGIVDKSVQDATESARAKADVDRYAEGRALEAAEAWAKQSGEAQELEVQIDGVSTAIKVMPNGKVIKVTDEGTSKATQREIDQIKGKAVSIEVTDNGRLAEISRELDALGNVRRVLVDVTGRTGTYYE